MNIKKDNPIKKLHITEKAAIASESNAYIFQVEKSATKTRVLRQIEETYKVKPMKVNMVNVKATRIFSKGKMGKTSSMKKAYVYLKKGDTINVA
jgi:large subunit ribosomal protein L23